MLKLFASSSLLCGVVWIILPAPGQFAGSCREPEQPDGAVATPRCVEPRWETPDVRSAAVEQIVTDIMRLRREQDNVLGDTIFTELGLGSEEQFAEILRQVVREGTSQSPPGGDTAGGEVTSSRSAGRDPARNCEQRYAQWVAAQREPTAEDTALVLTLRRSARLMDRKAHRLERHNDYETADRLRHLAEQVRQEARCWATRTGPTRQAREPLAPRR